MRSFTQQWAIFEVIWAFQACHSALPTPFPSHAWSYSKFLKKHSKWECYSAKLIYHFSVKMATLHFLHFIDLLHLRIPIRIFFLKSSKEDLMQGKTGQGRNYCEKHYSGNFTQLTIAIHKHKTEFEMKEWVINNSSGMLHEQGTSGFVWTGNYIPLVSSL